MAFHTDKTEFDKVFGAESTLTESFLMKLKDYLETKKMIRPFSDIYKRLLENKPVSAFVCRYDLAADMTEILGENEIPCLKVLAPNGKIGFITSSDDDEAIKNLQQELLRRLGRYMAVHTGDTLKQGIDGEKYTSAIALTGLSKAEAYLLKNYCEKETEIEAMGLDKMADGTWKATFYAEDALKKGEKGMMLAQTLLRVKLLLAGKHAELIKARVERQEQFEKLVAHDFDIREMNQGKPLCIIGEADQYVKISQHRFEYGNISREGGKATFIPLTTVEKALPNYREQLISYSFTLVNPIIAHNEHEIAAALTEPTIEMSNAELKEAMSQKAALAKTAEMVEAKKQYDPVMHQIGAFDKKFRDLLEKSTGLMIASVTGEYPHEYSNAEKEAFETVIEKNGVDLRDYKDVLFGAKDVEVTVEAKPFEKLKSIGELEHKEPAVEKSAPTREELGI